jgi:CheY-like chemotaxis protein
LDKPAVLVVEDDPGVRATAVDMLESLGLEVFDTYNGRDALRILSNQPEISALFTDVRMPGLSGTELANRARQMRPGLKVVLTSAVVGEEGLPRLDGFVPKPFTIDRLAAIFGTHQPHRH